MKQLLLLSLIFSAISASDEPAAPAKDTKPTLALLKTLVGHTASVSQIKFSAHAPHLLASASIDRTVKLWDVNSGQCVQTFGNQYVIGAINAISMIDNRIATGTSDEAIRIWDMQTGQIVDTWQAMGSVYDVMYSKDENQLATAQRFHYLSVPGRMGGSCHAWDSRSGNITYGWNNIGYVQRVLWTKDNNVIAASDNVYHFDCASRASTISDVSLFGDIALSDDNSMVIYVGQGPEKAMYVLDPVTCQLIRRLPTDDTTMSVTMVGKQAAIGYLDGVVRIIDLATGEVLAQVTNFDQTQYINSIASSIDNNYIAAASSMTKDIKINTLQ